jgi:hypothetical protein
MKRSAAGMTLDRPAGYEIRVQGYVRDDWSDSLGDLSIGIETDRPPITVLRGTVADQAALQGLLTSLYSLGLPLLSVRFLDTD